MDPCYPARTVSIFRVARGYGISCYIPNNPFGSQNKFIYAPISKPSARLELGYSSGIPISARLEIYVETPSSFIAKFVYPSKSIVRRFDVSPGKNYIDILPSVRTNTGIEQLKWAELYAPDGSVLGVIYPERIEISAKEIEVYADEPSEGVLISYGGGRRYISWPIYQTSNKQVYMLPQGAELVSLLGYTKYGKTFFYSGPSHDISVKYGSPYMVVLSLYQQPAEVTATFLDVFSIPNAVVGFLSSIPKSVGEIIRVFEQGFSAITATVSNSIQNIGSTIAHAVSSAWNWATTTKIDIGPVSMSILDLAVTIGSIVLPVLVPVGVATVAGSLTARALTALGISGRLASAIVSAVRGVSAGVTAFTVGKLTGASDLESLIDVVTVGISTFFGSTKLLLGLAGVSTVASFLLFQEEQPATRSETAEQQKADQTIASSVVKLCSDPALSVLPLSECEKIIGQASLSPFAFIESVEPVRDGLLIPGLVTVHVKNPTAYYGEFTLETYVDGKLVDSRTISIQGGSRISVQIVLPAGSQVTFRLLYQRAEIDRKTYSIDQKSEVTAQTIELLNGLVGLAVIVSAISLPLKRIARDEKPRPRGRG